MQLRPLKTPRYCWVQLSLQGNKSTKKFLKIREIAANVTALVFYNSHDVRVNGRSRKNSNNKQKVVTWSDSPPHGLMGLLD